MRRTAVDLGARVFALASRRLPASRAALSTAAALASGGAAACSLSSAIAYAEAAHTNPTQNKLRQELHALGLSAPQAEALLSRVAVSIKGNRCSVSTTIPANATLPALLPLLRRFLTLAGLRTLKSRRLAIHSHCETINRNRLRSSRYSFTMISRSWRYWAHQMAQLLVRPS